uniref:PH domain-containing protein n=1 Tax=Podarcis muralis TaxID=64176 RepID=A0A670JJE6_PODMU
MWKDTEYFKNKGELHRCAVFCLLQIAPSVAGPKYQLLACTTLRLAHIQDAFRTHDLAVTGNEESSFWLPLYGSVCCRLAAQPNSMLHQVMCGFLKVQGEQQGWLRLFCLLRGSNLLCYRHPKDVETQEEAAFTIAINKETRIRATEKDPKNQLHTMSVTNRYGGEEVTHTLLAESRSETQRWMETFWQHFYDMSQWKHCCDELMKVEVPSPRRPMALLQKQGSLYHEMAIEPADDIEAVTEILQELIRIGSFVQAPPPQLHHPQRWPQRSPPRLPCPPTAPRFSNAPPEFQGYVPIQEGRGGACCQVGRRDPPHLWGGGQPCLFLEYALKNVSIYPSIYLSSI